MTRNVLIFIGTFVLGALAALVARAAMHKPYTAAPAAPAANEYAAMVNNTLAPAGATEPRSADDQAPANQHPPQHGTSHGEDRSAHGAGAPSPAAQDAPVNTVCAICGMKVDPSLPTAEYQGKKIGFGCRMCPPKFKADPDKYGPYYLRNETIKKR